MSIENGELTVARDYRPDIDGLRAVAVILVIAGHLGVPLASHGYVGVDVFFVISGYLITRIIQRELDSGSFSLLNFYERRIRRIFPALFACIFVAFIAAWFVLLPDDYSELARSAIWTSASASNVFFLLRGGYFTGPADFKPLLHTWSLGVEEQFYLVIPISLLIIRKAGARLVVPLYVLAWGISLVLAIMVAQWQVLDLSAKTAFFLTPFRAWELMTGGLIALVPALERRAASFGNLLASAGLALILASALGYELVASFPGLGAVPPVLGAALVIASGNSASWARRPLTFGPMVRIGLFSYSLYLFHWPVLSLYRYSVQRQLSEIEIAVLFSAFFALAYASWRWIEQPFRRVASKRWVVWAGALAAIGLAILTGISVKAFAGVPSRFSREVVEMAHGAGALPEARSCEPLEHSEVAFCRYGDRQLSGPTVALVGDSHIGAIEHDFVEIAESLGVGVVVSSTPGCPPLLGIDSPSTANGCVAHYRRLYEQLGRDDRIETVVLVSRWALFAEGRGYDLGEIAIVGVHEGTSREVFEAAVSKSINQLTGQGKAVAVLGPIPEQDSYGFTRAAIELRRGRAPTFGISTPIHKSRTKAVDLVFRQLAESGLLRFYTTNDVLCSGESCLAADQGRVYYADDDHLTRQGARRLRPVFARMLSEVAGHLTP